MTPVLMGQLPAGCSSRQPRHYIQLQASNRFAQFDFGKENQRIYGRATPPEYALEKITAPIALYYGQNDNLCAVEDVQRLRMRLPNVVEDHMYPYKKWNHVDMIWGISSRRRAQPRMLMVMQRCEAGEGLNGTGSTTEQGELVPTPTIAGEEGEDEREQQEGEEDKEVEKEAEKQDELAEVEGSSK